MTALSDKLTHLKLDFMARELERAGVLVQRHPRAELVRRAQCVPERHTHQHSGDPVAARVLG